MLSMPLAFVALALAGCGAKEQVAATTSAQQNEKLVGSALPQAGRVNALLHAVVYRTAGDYADLVPVGMNAERTRITSFPAPSDIRPATSKPIALDGGYLLDRRGVGENSVFLDYTYEEYARLPQVPPIDTLMAHVVDFHPIVELYVLPLNADKVWSDPSLANAYVEKAFAGCKVVVSAASKRE